VIHSSWHKCIFQWAWVQAGICDTTHSWVHIFQYARNWAGMCDMTHSVIRHTTMNESCHTYGVVMTSRLLTILGLFCKRALQKRRDSAKETYNFKEPTNRSHPIPAQAHVTHRVIRHDTFNEWHIKWVISHIEWVMSHIEWGMSHIEWVMSQRFVTYNSWRIGVTRVTLSRIND